MLLLSLSGCAVWTQALNKMGFEDEPQAIAEASQKPAKPRPLKYDVPAGVEIMQRFELPPDADGQSVNGWLGQDSKGEWIFFLQGRWWTFYPKTRSAEVVEIRQIGDDDLIIVELQDRPCGFNGAEEFKNGYSYRFFLVTGTGRPLSERRFVQHKPGNECRKLDFSEKRGSLVARMPRIKNDDLAGLWWIENHDFRYEVSTSTDLPPTKKKKSKKLFGIF